jgi:hypothetical protein
MRSSALPFFIKVGSLTVIARSATDVLHAVEKLVADDELVEPIVSTFDGITIDIDDLRGIVADLEP